MSVARTSPVAWSALLLACSSGTEPVVNCDRLPVAPQAMRVDLAPPVFSNPTTITNPLFPISRLASAVLLGSVDGLPFRTETTLMPGTRPLTVNGRTVATLESQYVAYLDGRIHEVALDWYAQADDGAVWYLGEDVFNFEDGVVADQHGTWQVGRNGPAAMIMPATPRVGDVYRPENACPVVFEEVTVKATGVTVNGPSGPIQGAVVVSELHMEGDREDKTFAPGYGEFSTSHGGDVEAMAVAADTDRRPGPEPSAIAAMINNALQAEAAAAAGNWTAAGTAAAAMRQASSSYPAGAPPLLAAEMQRVLNRLDASITARNAHRARVAAVEAARAALDFRLMHAPPAVVDRTRLVLWSIQLGADAAVANAAFVRGSVAAAEHTWTRIANGFDAGRKSPVEAALRDLRASANRGDHAAASAAATSLRSALGT